MENNGSKQNYKLRAKDKAYHTATPGVLLLRAEVVEGRFAIPWNGRMNDVRGTKLYFVTSIRKLSAWYHITNYVCVAKASVSKINRPAHIGV